MNNLTNETLPALPAAWIDRLWQRFYAMYGNRFADMWRALDPDAVKQAWAEDLHGYTAEELKRGLEWCRSKEWPPTLPEFMAACRPKADPKIEWAEAVEQMRIRLEGRGLDNWSRPQVYWAAVAIGWYDLNNTSWDTIRPRWIAAITKAKGDPIPAYVAALPKPGAQTVTAEAAEARMGELKAAVMSANLAAPGLSWAYRLMEREASGERLFPLSAAYWREAIGLPADANAKHEWQKTTEAKNAA